MTEKLKQPPVQYSVKYFQRACWSRCNPRLSNEPNGTATGCQQPMLPDAFAMHQHSKPLGLACPFTCQARSLSLYSCRLFYATCSVVYAPTPCCIPVDGPPLPATSTCIPLSLERTHTLQPLPGKKTGSPSESVACRSLPDSPGRAPAPAPAHAAVAVAVARPSSSRSSSRSTSARNSLSTRRMVSFCGSDT